MYKSGQKPDRKGRPRKPEGRPVGGGERPSAFVCTSQATSGEGQGQVGEWLEWQFLETLSLEEPLKNLGGEGVQGLLPNF